MWYNIGNDPTTQDALVEQPKPTSRITGLYESAVDALNSSPIPILARTLRNSIINITAPHILSQAEIKNSPYYDPDLDFPDGVSEEVLKLSHEENVANKQREDLINNMPSGFLSWSSKQIGSLAGTFMSPGNMLLTYKALPLLFEKEAATDIAGRSFIGNMANAASRGALEGTAFAAPTALSQLAFSSSSGQQVNPIDEIQGIIDTAALGAFAHSATRAYRVVSKDALKEAQAQTVNQMMNDVRPDATTTLKAGYNETGKPTIEEMPEPQGFNTDQYKTNTDLYKSIADSKEEMEKPYAQKQEEMDYQDKTDSLSDPGDLTKAIDELKKAKPFVVDPEAHLQAVEHMKKYPFVNLTKGDFEKDLAENFDLKNDSSLHPDQDAIYDEMLSNTSDEKVPFQKETEENFNNLKKENGFNEDIAKDIDGISDEEQKTGTIERALKGIGGFINCIRGSE